MNVNRIPVAVASVLGVAAARGRSSVGELRLLGGPVSAIEYESVIEAAPEQWVATAHCGLGDSCANVEDRWRAARDAVHLERRVVMPPADRVRGLHVRIAIELADPRTQLRPFVPSNLYESAQLPDSGELSYSDGRTSYPMVAVHNPVTQRMLVLLREDLAEFDDGLSRRVGATDYLHTTDVGSVGLVIEERALSLIAEFPYFEGPGGAYLDSAGTPARAYWPVPPQGATLVLRYTLAELPAPDYARGVRAALELALTTRPTNIVQLPFSLVEAIELRRDSMAKTYVEWAHGGGFLLNFDPDHGYASPPRAFGASFTKHRMERARDILEFGFTGRQLNVAYVLAAGGDPAWRQRRRRICDFFVRAMVTDAGFCFSHFDLAEQRPLYSIGDPRGRVLHYLATADTPGSYLRLMSETASDLLLNCREAAAHGEDTTEWRDAVGRIAGFLIRAQQPDGSWLRAYSREGVGISGGGWLGEGETATSATGAPVPFLLAAAEELPELAPQVVGCAERAVHYLLEHQVRPASFRGGTLDNPNVIDKESAFIAMAALVAMHRRDPQGEYLDAAHAAACIGASWTLLWDIPSVAGTRVDRAGVRSTGWGGINSIWGAGVTDIYSLFYLADLAYLAEHACDPLLKRIAELSAHGTAQLLAHPGDRFEMTDTGMQPEGIAHCGQGVDEGLIAKGDTWGGLAWMYTAGTYGLAAYLEYIRRNTATTAGTVLA